MTTFNNLSKLPGSPQLHRWADWAEVLALTSANGMLSSPGLSAAVQERDDFLSHELDDAVEPNETKLDELSSKYETAAEFNEATTRRAVDVFAYLSERSRLYGDSYPFSVDNDRRTLHLRDASSARDLYLLLLAGATFRYVDKPARRGDIAARFEVLSAAALKHRLPLNATVNIFGVNPLAGVSPYSGLLINKIRLLATHLFSEVVAKEKDFEKNDSGDGGLDVVAWVPTGDNLPGRLTILGQCACTPAWVTKQHSSSYSSWKNNIKFSAEPLNYCFMPFDFRRPDGTWYADRLIQNAVLMDRYRIVSSLVDEQGALIDPHVEQVVSESGIADSRMESLNDL